MARPSKPSMSRRPSLVGVKKEAPVVAPPAVEEDLSPVDVQPEPAIVPDAGETALEAVTRQLFGGKGDHDGDGRPGGAHAPVDPPSDDAEQPETETPASEAPIAREEATEPVRVPSEPSLHELNLEARMIDRDRERALGLALDRMMEAAGSEEMFEAVLERYSRTRRNRKSLRPVAA